MNRTKSIPSIGRLFIIALLSLGSAATLTTAARAQSCPCYPIALSSQTLAGLVPGAIVKDIWNGAQPGNFGWLSWAGDPGEPTLVDSLTQPGDSGTYVNPLNPNDHTLVPGDWVSGRPGVSNGKHVRNGLNALIGLQIIVPVWDQVRGTGNNVTYHVSAFAVVEILNYDLPSQNRITAQFLGYSDCGTPGPN